MELFDHLTTKIDYTNCEFLMDAVNLIYAEVKSLGIEKGDVLHFIRKELGIRYLGSLYKDFDELKNSEIFKEALSNVFKFEEMAGTYHWDVVDVVLGMMLLHGHPKLREKLSTLPYRES